MQKKIVAVNKMGLHGHLMLDLEDGTKQTVFRGDHEAHSPKPGDLWPPEGHEHVTAGVQTGGLVKKG
jgi:hypothetical protein